MKEQTLVNHPPSTAPRPDNEPLVAPIYQSVKFTIPHVDELGAHLARGGYFYSRAQNPTLRQLEVLLAALQGQGGDRALDALVVGSGVAALTVCLLGLLRAGDHVVLFVESYPPTRYLVRSLLSRFGVTSTLLSQGDEAGLVAALAQRPTRLILCESPTNPMLRVADLGRLAELARLHGALLLCDNTFAGLHNHGGQPVDVYVHSLTKFAGGHGDVMGGVIIAEPARIDALRKDAVQIGATLDPHAAYLILRGLKTYFLRYERQCQNAARVADWLAAQPQVARLRYPGRADHPQHALARAQQRDFGALVSFDLDGARSAARFVDALRVFRFAASLGSTESLAMPVHRFFAGDLSDEEARAAGIGPGSIRLSVGIEDVDDLIADLGQALPTSG